MFVFFFLKEGFSFSMWYRFQYMKGGSCLAAICVLHGDVQGLALHCASVCPARAGRTGAPSVHLRDQQVNHDVFHRTCGSFF